MVKDQTALDDMRAAQTIAVESLKGLSPVDRLVMMSTIKRIEDFIYRIQRGYIMTAEDYQSFGLTGRSNN